MNVVQLDEVDPKDCYFISSCIGGEHVKHPNEVRNPSEVFMLLLSTLQLVGCSSAKKSENREGCSKHFSTTPPKTNMKAENHAFQKGFLKKTSKPLFVGEPHVAVCGTKLLDLLRMWMTDFKVFKTR